MNLDEYQQAAVESRLPVTVAVAGPGSGKSRCVIERIVWLYEQGIQPSEIYVMTFTNAAADELTDRLDYRMGGRITLGWCGTLHGFALDLLRKHGNKVGLPADVTVGDEGYQAVMLSTAAAEVGYKGSAKALKQQALMAFGHVLAKNSLIPIEAAVKRYVDTMRRTGVLHYDAVLQFAADLALSGGVTLGGHLLVDEYQDSGSLDDYLYDYCGFSTKFFVGDINQSLYSWRGGDPRRMMRRATADVTRFLPVNYRCGCQIMSKAQQLIQHNKIRIPYESIAVAANGTGEVVVHSNADDAEEIAALALDIVMKSREHPDWTFAVLLRTNKLVETFTDGLAKAGVHVKDRRKWVAPANWGVLKAFVAMMAAPRNDQAALWFIQLHKGMAAVVDARAKALCSGTPVSERWVGGPVRPTAGDVYGFAQTYFPLADVRKALDPIYDQVPSGEDRPATWLLERMQELEQSTLGDGTGVHVGTYHSAKGLEFDAVYLPALEDQIIPGASSVPEDIEEERRLVFVGITRAKAFLCLSSCRRRRNPWTGVVEPATPSRFIAEAEGKL